MHVRESQTLGSNTVATLLEHVLPRRALRMYVGQVRPIVRPMGPRSFAEMVLFRSTISIRDSCCISTWLEEHDTDSVVIQRNVHLKSRTDRYMLALVSRYPYHTSIRILSSLSRSLSSLKALASSYPFDPLALIADTATPSVSTRRVSDLLWCPEVLLGLLRILRHLYLYLYLYLMLHLLNRHLEARVRV